MAAKVKFDLAMFCGPAGGTFALDRLEVRGGWRYATDGHWCGRMRAETGEPDTEATLPPTLEHIFKRFPKRGWEPLPKPGRGRYRVINGIRFEGQRFRALCHIPGVQMRILYVSGLLWFRAPSGLQGCLAAARGIK